ncbi:hypothetical protein SAMN05216337_103329 [Bradyrhizobium brasilense]|uniref:Uncharacterized protein n=1 Tax=Bradyrhizobium brasilense TaxID=1419277 RepID=A0A1G7F926_9BRAD|nr:hypothetical protein [Bradyrhizobium brasilense]SDE72336.1 hypothetical protein SAMN05216337_103329 [Bradyrhizobium brasilense]
MTKKITRRHLKNGLVAFVDLLGFSARVESIRTEQELRALDDDVAFAQNEFGHKSSDKFTRQSDRAVGKSVLAFSDCLVLSVPLRSPLTPIQGTFDILMSELSGFALSQGTCVLEGIFVRGGIDLGIWYRRQDSLISPALVQAYGLERDACVPMIAITTRLRRYLSNHPHRRFYSDDLDPISRTLKQYRKLPNGKTLWFINYLRICLDSIEPVIVGEDRKKYLAADADGRDRMRTEAWQKACLDWAKHHGQAILKSHASAEVASVRAKYAWLAKYHNEEVKRFFGKAAKPLLIKPV